jgi:AraC family transcriptional regulator
MSLERTMSIADKAAWIIERNSGRELTLSSIAESCGVSRSHLANAFGTATGLSVIGYLRGRRLSEAANALAGGAPDILAVALDAGYASHEAFTRAFRDQFGMTPERVRERQSTGGLPLIGPVEFGGRVMPQLAPPNIRERPAMRIVGLSDSITWSDAAHIPLLWQRFMAFFPFLKDQVVSPPIGVICPAREDGRFEYLCAFPVSRFADIPDGLVARDIPAQRCAVFAHEGHITRIGETYAAIFNRALPEHGMRQVEAPVIEDHNPTFDPRTGEGGLTIWIPIAPTRHA